MRRPLVAAVACVLAACTLTDLQGFSGGDARDAGASPATNDASGSGGPMPGEPEAGSEGGTSSGTLDGGGSPTDGAPTPNGFCGTQTNAKACYDFDSNVAPAGSERASKGTVEVSGGEIDARIDANSGGVAYLRLDMDASPTHVTVGFDVRLDQIGRYIEFGAIQFEYGGGGYCGLEPSVSDGIIRVTEFCNAAAGDLADTHDLGAVGAVGGFHHFEINVAFDTRKWDVSIKRPDGELLTRSPATLDARIVKGTRGTAFLAGAIYGEPFANGHRMRLDNIVMRWD